MSCTVDGCARTVRARGLCGMHYFRQWRSGDPGEATPRQQPSRPCAVEGCNARARTRGLCHRHATRVRRHGSPAIVHPLAQPRHGAENRAWTGDAATYNAVHYRLRNLRGSAAELECVDCGEQARHWSYDHLDPAEQQSEYGPYSVDLEHYQPRCVPCHRRTDSEAKARTIRP